MAKRTFTHSELANYQDCPKKWWFKYDQLLDTPKPDNKLTFGKLIHEALDTFYKTNNMESAIIAFIEKCNAVIKAEDNEERQEEMLELKTTGISMLKMYKDFAIMHDDFKVIYSEIAEIVPISTPSGRQSTAYEYAFKCDQIIEWNGNLWIHEFKTAASIGDGYLENLVLDEQMSRYAFGCEKKFGKEITGIIYSILRKKIPTIPEKLVQKEKKDGTLPPLKLSKDKRIDTTTEVYLKAIKDNGLNPDDYAEILEMLENKGNTFIVREVVLRNAREKEECEQRLWTLCKTLNTDAPIYKCPSRDCGWKCPYRILCIEDTPEARSAFIVRKKYHPEYEEKVGEEQGGVK